MSQTTPPTITAAPAVPIRGTPTFKLLVDAFLTWMALAVTQFQALATNVYNNAVDCYNNAVAAAISAANAAASAIAALATANATAWVSGTTYALNANAISQIDFYTYRRRVAGAGTTDPKNDPTNWVLISAAYARTQMHVREQQTSGTAGGNSVANDFTQTRMPNTTATNTIPGASVASGLFTLPAGTYILKARAPSSANAHRALWYNTTDSTYTIPGSTAYCQSGTATHTDSVVIGVFTIAAQKVFALRHWTATAITTNGLGYPAGSGTVEIYSEVLIEKIA